MQTDAPLRGRAREILHSIVREYIETGEPVGSRTISKQRKDNLSAASIRNVMMDLADEGYLSQPHTSAGRVPTEKAFQEYVKSLTAGRLHGADAERLRSQILELPSIEERIERSSHILTELTRNIGIAAAMPLVEQELDQIELVPLADCRVLMILVTRDHRVRNRVVVLDEPASPEELASVRNYVNRNFGGWRLGDARRELLRRMAEERAAYDALMQNLMFFYERGLLESGSAPEVHLEGVSNLVLVDLHLTREKMRDLLRALEEKRRLIELLDHFLEYPPGELAVRVGLEQAHPAMKEFALIGIRLRMPGGMNASVAVLGPMRMHYEKVMSAVLHIGRAFEDAR